MNRKLLAAALGKGIEAAALLEYTEALIRLASNDALVGDVFTDTKGNIVVTRATTEPGFHARWRVEPIQQIQDDEGDSVELHVHASDGKHELEAYFYVGKAPKPVS